MGGGGERWTEGDIVKEKVMRRTKEKDRERTRRGEVQEKIWYKRKLK